MAFEFDFQAEAQCRPDHHDDRQDASRLQCRPDGDHSNDVGSDEQLEPEQDRSAEMLPVQAISTDRAVTLRKRCRPGRNQNADDEGCDTDDIDRLADGLDRPRNVIRRSPPLSPQEPAAPQPLLQ
jgi:hypothetical protein